ncbi:MAG: alpha/beta fold hydrolase [Sporomusaceae bacterium]|nr:alpha/beta fold hydrolase [Sporomusaceae bacterium]
MKRHEWISSENRQLSAMIHVDSYTVNQTPVIICCHGFTSEKIGSNQLMLNIARAITAAGLIALRFDFSGSGESDGEFATDTVISKWRQDLANVVNWVRNRPEFEGLPVYLLGHSLGGLIVLSHHDDAIAGRVVLAPVVHPVDNFRNEILGPELWNQSLSGKDVANFLGKGFTIGPDFVADLVRNQYEPLHQLDRLGAPLLVVHGQQDAVVPPAGSQELYRQYSGEKEIAFLAADHVFTGRHSEVTALVTNWLRRWQAA